MALSNRSAVEANNIPADERLDLTIPRNGSLVIQVVLTEIDDDEVETPVDLTNKTITAKASASYQAKTHAIAATVTDRVDLAGTFTLTFDASEAKGLGIDMPDLVHDLVLSEDGTPPRRYWAGLMLLSKGVG